MFGGSGFAQHGERLVVIVAAAMDRLKSIIAALAGAAGHLPPLVQLALGGLAAIVAGSLVAGQLPRLGGLVRFAGNVALVAVLVLAGLSYVRPDPAFDAVLPSLGFRAQQVVGSETRVPLSADGHYWIDGTVNGVHQRFMVDTGATLTVLSHDTAEVAGIAPDPLRMPVILRTAGGPAEARLGTIDNLRAGSVEARGLDAIVTGAASGVNVLGMNFLSRLKGWRVEDGVLVLAPASPSAAATLPGG